MTDIKWGPAIPVDGKRPGWLGDGEAVQYHHSVEPAGKWCRACYAIWDDKDWRWVSAIRLPADHPHYRQTEKVGDAHLNSHYPNWDGDLEAYNEDGRVVPVKLLRTDRAGDRCITPALDGKYAWFRWNGATWSDAPWRIRNVPQPTPQADTKPDLTAEVEDMGQQLAALMERHEALAERVARLPHPSAIRTMDLRLDPDLIEARKLVAERTGRLQIECGYSRSVLDGEQDDHPAVINTLAAIKRGRALALAGEKEA